MAPSGRRAGRGGAGTADQRDDSGAGAVRGPVDPRADERGAPQGAALAPRLHRRRSRASRSGHRGRAAQSYPRAGRRAPPACVSRVVESREHPPVSAPRLRGDSRDSRGRLAPRHSDGSRSALTMDRDRATFASWAPGGLRFASMALECERVELLYAATRSLAAFDDVDELVRFATRRLREVFGADGCAILLLDEKRREFCFPVASQREGAAASASTLGEVRFPA